MDDIQIDALSGVDLAIAMALALGWQWAQDEDGLRVLVGPDYPENGVVWQRRYYPDRHVLGSPYRLPDYPHDIGTAWILVADAERRGYTCRIQTPLNVTLIEPWAPDRYWAGFAPHGTLRWEERPDHWTRADNVPTAIGRAWLKLMQEVPDGPD